MHLHCDCHTHTHNCSKGKSQVSVTPTSSQPYRLIHSLELWVSHTHHHHLIGSSQHSHGGCHTRPTTPAMTRLATPEKSTCNATVGSHPHPPLTRVMPAGGGGGTPRASSASASAAAAAAAKKARDDDDDGDGEGDSAVNLPDPSKLPRTLVTNTPLMPWEVC